ncbi:hypothetical protein VTK73DRAFT_4072 [Phialemonium thermophilum]|uniref:Chromo domain-containing protein n=1 Tax=Phialemonium thermophilum TaxID=223376 RepID=A0ABR3VBZ8_9PEZI
MPITKNQPRVHTPSRRRRKYTSKNKTKPARQEEPSSDDDSGPFYAVRDILDEKHEKGRLYYLIDWEDDPKTGERYEPTWVCLFVSRCLLRPTVLSLGKMSYPVSNLAWCLGTRPERYQGSYRRLGDEKEGANEPCCPARGSTRTPPPEPRHRQPARPGAKLAGPAV